jgi:CheY-like chemotaxis protein
VVSSAEAASILAIVAQPSEKIGKHKRVIDKNTNPNRSEAKASEEHPDLQACFAAAGLPHTVTVSSALSAQLGWVGSSPPGNERYDIAQMVWLTLNGLWLHRKRKTPRGEALVLEFASFVKEDTQAIDLQLAIVVGDDQKLRLTHPDELDQPGVKHACLLAEDEPELARLIGSMLERASFKVTHTPDGNEAWRLAQTRAFDVVVLDIDLPGLNGLEICQRIKAAPPLAQLPVVLCSGRIDLAEVAKLAGADDYVAKPFEILELADRLKRLLEPPRPPDS